MKYFYENNSIKIYPKFRLVQSKCIRKPSTQSNICIWVNPTNLNEIVVAAVGHLYTTNKERGIYKSTDGGKSWKQTLFVTEDAGIIDLAVSKSNPKIMFAASWQKDRKAWHFDGDGEKIRHL